MASLVVRNLDEQIVRALKERATRHQRSAEAEHRAILEQALLQPRRRSLLEVLEAIPEVGSDEDFERMQDRGQTRDVFD